MKKLYGVLLLLLVWLLPMKAHAVDGQIVFVYTNDVHGQIEVEAYIPSVTAAYRSQYGNDHVIQVSIGDVYSGTVFASLTKGESVVPVMNAAGYQAMVIGNADVMNGPDQTKLLAAQSSFPVLSANLLDQVGNHYLDATTIFQCGSIKVGVFGITTPDLKGPSAVSDTTAAAQGAVAALQAAGCEYIVALSHLGFGDSYSYSSTRLAAEVPGIDLIIDGHSHTVLEKYVCPTSGAVIVQAGEYGDYIGVVEMTVNSGTVVSTDHTLVSRDTYTTAYAPDAAVQNIIDQTYAEIDTLTSEVVATVDYPMEGAREYVRTGQTNLGSFITDAMRYATGADVAIYPGALIRDSVDAGDVTLNSLLGVVSAGADIYYQEQVTGAELRALLTDAIAQMPEQYSAFHHVSGISYTYYLSDEGNQIVDIFYEDGTPLTDTDAFSIAYDLLAYDMLGHFDISGLTKVADGQTDMVTNILVPYITSSSCIIASDNGGRATEVFSLTTDTSEEESSTTSEEEASTENSEEETETSTSNTEEMASTSTTDSGTNETATGKKTYPDTGEHRTQLMMWVGSALVLLSISFYLLRKRQASK